MRNSNQKKILKDLVFLIRDVKFTFNGIQHYFASAERRDPNTNKVLFFQSCKHCHIDFVLKKEIYTKQ